MKREAEQPVRRPTLNDVAALSGMSRAQVSIVMRGAPGASPETRKRVREAAAMIGYHPDARARMLASGKSRLIGVIFGMLGRFHLDLVEGVYREAEKAGFQVILSALTPQRDERQAVGTLLDFRCEAAIILAPDRPVPLLHGRIPVVTVAWHAEDSSVDGIRTSDAEGMRLAVDHLVALGHRRILHIDGGPGPIPAARRNAYRDAMRQNGLESEARVVSGGLGQEEGYLAAQEILQRNELPTAIVGYNDDVAAGTLKALAAAGVSVPDDVSVTGWDDSSLASLPHLDLTTVRQDSVEITRLAVERCVARLNDESIGLPQVTLEPELVIRTSTANVKSDQDA